ncbi:MAG: TIM barrel protein, partial [Atopobiaceae bacterium]|nr:TIM barrel protein [Atopobiaceae bacterium]
MAKLKKSQLTMGSFHYAFYPFEFFCDSMKRLGIDSVEVSANRGHLWTAGDGVERAAEMRRQLEAAGVSRVACVCAEQNGFPYNIAAKDDARRAASVAYMSDTIRCAAALGSPIVLLCPG